MNDTIPRDTPILRLQHGDASVELCPGLGGTILRYSWRGIPILRPSDGLPDIARLTACYPLLPYSNRIGGGRLRFGGHAYAIPPTVDYAPLPMHGLAWQRPWRIASRTGHQAVLEQDYVPEDASPAWPFPYAARQTFDLRENGLRMTLSIRNTGTLPQPAGLGWHPYFPRTAETWIRAGVGDMWVNDADHLPTHLAPPPAALATRLAVTETDYDNVFRDFSGHACVAWPERDAAVRLEADAAFSHLVIFTPPGKPHLAIEPVSHMTDAFNRYAGGTAASGNATVADPATGTVVLAPGATLAGGISLLPSTLAEAGAG
ncbi:aldose 1-epimerase [Bordetella genomosp. 8]|nr:aldose 1-epimerase [Bordetella genomosp. 8]